MCTSSCDEMECRCSLGQPARLVPVPAQERPLTHPCMHARTDLDPTDIGLNRSIDRAGKLKVLLHGHTWMQSTRREKKKMQWLDTAEKLGDNSVRSIMLRTLL